MSRLSRGRTSLQGTVVLGIAVLSVMGCKKGPEYKQNEFSSRNMKATSADVDLPVSLWAKLEAVFAAGDTPGGGHGGGHSEAAKTEESHGEAGGEPGSDRSSSHEAGSASGHGEENAHEAKGHGEDAHAAENHESGDHGGGHEAAASSPKTEVPTRFMGVKVYLIEKNRGILGGQNFELTFGDGGGELDLKDFLENRNGTFYFAVEPILKGAEDGTVAPARVFYLSNATRRKLGRESVGAGCRTYHEISTYFHKAMTKTGIQVNTTTGRHVSALAGTYFFAIPHRGELHLTQVTVKDSRFRNLHCKR